MSIYLREPGIPTVRIGVYPKRRAGDFIAPRLRFDEPRRAVRADEVSYADFFRTPDAPSADGEWSVDQRWGVSA